MSIRLTVCLTALVGLSACDSRAPEVVVGPGEQAVERGVGKQDATPYEERDRSRDGAISGRVTLKGDPPRLPKPPVTHECRAHGDVPSERIMVDGQGGLKNVFVYVHSRGLRGWSFRTPTEAIFLNQEGCRFDPRVQGMIAGQPMRIRNSDSFLHNVKSVPQKNDSWSIGLLGNSEVVLTTTTSNGRTLSKSEVMVGIRCDVHGWMSSSIGVLRHPLFAVTDETGAFTIKGVPPGTYEVRAWHVFYGNPQARPTPTRKLKETIMVKSEETALLDFEFKE